MGNKELRVECVVRMLSMVLAAVAALLVGMDSQTKTVFFVTRKASVKDLDALWVMTIVTSVTAGYHLLQLLRCVAFAWLGRNPCQCYKFAAWLYFLLDQGVAYAIFGVTMAGLQGSLVGVFGVGSLQWSKLCNIYSRFCRQVAVGVLCNLAASLAMAVVSTISAHRLFRLYPQRPGGRRRRWLLFSISFTGSRLPAATSK